MKIDVELTRRSTGKSYARPSNIWSGIICYEWIEEAFGITADKITLHLSTEEDIDAYLVKYDGVVGALVYKGKTSSSPILERHSYVYQPLRNLLMKFPGRMAFLSVSYEADE
jgi:hypothetical protein